MDTIEAKILISKNKKPESWFGNLYNMNIYKGCNHGCIYCDSRSSCYNIKNFDTILAKKDALKLIERDLMSKKTKGIVGTGAMSDPYNPHEKKETLTREALKLINKYNFGVNIYTKSSLVTRDIDILKEIKTHSPAIVGITITTIDDTIAKEIEPFVDVTSKRLKALKELSKNGIFCGALMMPILPFINDKEENIRGIVEAVSKNGGRYIYPCFGVTLRGEQRFYFFDKLDEKFQGIKEEYINAYKNNYYCESKNVKKLYAVFKEECIKNKILYKMPEIIKASNKEYEKEQLNFFDNL